MHFVWWLTLSSRPDPLAQNPQNDSKRTTGEAVVWLLADMLLVAGGMAALVKAQGVEYPAFQLVFIRAFIGLLFIIPLIWRHRYHIRNVHHPWRNLNRVICNAIALISQFIAYALMPLALVNALGFARPLVTMFFAALMLKETINKWQWTGAIIAFFGVMLIISPGSNIVWGVGLAAIAVNVIFGSLATIQTRMLQHENTTVMMVFYTVGLVVITAAPAYWTWQPINSHDWLPLIGIGLLAQLGQYCFLRAYKLAPASILAPIGYLSLIVSAISGYIFFSEVPSLRLIIGSIIILAALQITKMIDRRIKNKL